MNTQDKNEDYQLWRKVAKPAGEANPGKILDPNILAAYLDGSATEEEISVVEEAMSEDPALLEEVIELRELQAINPVEISKPTHATILNAVLDTIAGISASLKVRPTSKLTFFDWMQTAAGVAAVLVVSLFGYELGQDTMTMDVQAISAVSEEIAESLDEATGEQEFLNLSVGNVAEEGLS
ncbi:MAG: hypothetical protein JXA52_02235 [Planctomycetes bacterium]|nr:hypothetical protein [Planctomycetota bacterium]